MLQWLVGGGAGEAQDRRGCGGIPPHRGVPGGRPPGSALPATAKLTEVSEYEGGRVRPLPGGRAGAAHGSALGG